MRAVRAFNNSTIQQFNNLFLNLNLNQNIPLQQIKENKFIKKVEIEEEIKEIEKDKFKKKSASI